MERTQNSDDFRYKKRLIDELEEVEDSEQSKEEMEDEEPYLYVGSSDSEEISVLDEESTSEEEEEHPKTHQTE